MPEYNDTDREKYTDIPEEEKGAGGKNVPSDYDEEEIITDPVNELKLMAKKKIDQIGYIDAGDIMDAFKDKLRNGQNTTSIEMREDYITPDGKETLRSISKLITFEPRLSLESSGEFTILIFDFKEQCPDINIMWDALEEFGKTVNEYSNLSTEMPEIFFTVVPLSLGGNYAMFAGCPVFWSLQPSMPFSDQANQIRVMFHSDAVLFVYDPTIDTDKMTEQIQHEYVSEQITAEQVLRAEAEQAEFDSTRKEFVNQFIEGNANRRHSFQVDKQNSNNENK